MNGPADLMDGREADRFRLPGVWIDLDLYDVAGPSVAPVCIAPVGLVVPADLRRLPIFGGDDERSVPAQVLPRRQFPQSRTHLLGAALEDPPDDHAGAGGHGRPAVRHLVGVRRTDLDPVVRQAEGVRDNLGEHRTRPLAYFGAGDENARPPSGQRERRLRRELDLAAAGEARAMEEERQAD